MTARQFSGGPLKICTTQRRVRSPEVQGKGPPPVQAEGRCEGGGVSCQQPVDGQQLGVHLVSQAASGAGEVADCPGSTLQRAVAETCG